jgi:hypothetical protein
MDNVKVETIIATVIAFKIAIAKPNAKFAHPQTHANHVMD